MFPQPVRLALRSVSRVISRNVSSKQLASSSVGSSSKRLDETFSRIDFEAKRSGRVMTKDLVTVFSLVKGAETSTPNHALMLLRCCGSLLIEEPPAKRNELLDQIWATLKGRQNLDISHYNALLQVYNENERIFNPLDFLREVEDAGLEANRVTYQRLIHTYCMKGDIEGATKILEFMKGKDIPVNESVFNSLILGYAVIGDYKSAQGTLDIMLKSDVLPTSATYTVLLKALAKNSLSDPQTFVSVLAKAEEDGVFFLDRQKLDIVKELLLAGADSKLVDSLLDTMQRKQGYSQDTANLTFELLNAGKVDEAIRIFHTIPISSIHQKTRSHGMFFVSQLVKCGQVPAERVFAFCKDLKDKGINEFALSKAAEIALEFRDKETGRLYLKEFLKDAEDPVPRPHYFWPLLCKCSSEEELMTIIAEDMEKVVFTASASQLIETLEVYVWPKVQDVGLILDRLKRLGYSYSILLTSLVKHYMNQQNMSAAIALLRDPKYGNIGILPQFLDNDIGLYLAKTGTAGEAVAMLKEVLRAAPYHTESDYVGICLDGLMTHGGLQREVKGQSVVTQLLRLFKQERIRISAEYRERLLNRHAMNETQKQLLTDIVLGSNEVFTGEGLEVDRALSRNVDDLENELIELKSKGMNTRGTLRNLLLRYCRQSREALVPDDDVDADGVSQGSNEAQAAAAKRVLEIVEEIDAIGMEMTDSMKAVLMEFYAMNGNIEKAFALREKFSPTFAVDDFKILNVAQFLVRAGRSEDAVRLLGEEINNPARIEKQREWGPDDTGNRKRPSIERSIFRLCNVAAIVTKDPKLVTQLFDLARSFRPAKPTNTLLGPLIKVHLLRNDLEGALEVFTNCVSTYKLTPWCGELMRMLIEKEDTANLQLLTDLSITCHGESNTLHDLAFSFVRAKKLNQGRKAMAKAGLRPNSNKIIAMTERLIREKDMDTLKNWIEVMQEVRDVDKDLLYYQLIRGFKNINDPQGALNVWTEMQEQGVVPSERTLAYLGNFVKSSGLKVPFAIPAAGEVLSTDRIANRSALPSIEDDFLKAMRVEDVAEAYRIRKERLSSGNLPTMAQECMLIDKMLEKNMIDGAFKIVSQLSRENMFPSPRILRTLSSALGKSGQVDKIEKIRPLLPAEFTNQTFFNGCVADAYIAAGQEETLLSKLHTLNPFPLSSMMTMMEKRPDLEPKVAELAGRMATSAQYHLPLNMLWLYRMKHHRFEEADSLIKSTPALRNNLLFSNVLKTIRETQDLVMADKLIDTISKTNLSSRSLGIAFSVKLDVLVDLDRQEEAEEMLLNLISNPIPRINDETGAVIPPTQLVDINRTSLIRLFNKLTEKTGRSPGFPMPERVDRDHGHSRDFESERVEPSPAAVSTV